MSHSYRQLWSDSGHVVCMNAVYHSHFKDMAMAALAQQLLFPCFSPCCLLQTVKSDADAAVQHGGLNDLDGSPPPGF